MDMLRIAWWVLTTALWVPLRRWVKGPRRPRWTLPYEATVRVMKGFNAPLNRAGDWRRFRALTDGMARRGPEARACRDEAWSAGGVTGRWCVPPQLRADGPVIIYFHGGAYLYGSTRTHWDLVARIATAARARVLTVEYRLAPEHPFPAGLDDAAAAVEAVMASGPPAQRVYLAGDSAGGGLALAALIRRRDEGRPLPAGAVLICPWVDHTARGGSLEAHKVYDWAEPEDFVHWSTDFLAGKPANHPWASPGLADLKGLPRLLVQVGTAEMLLDQVRALVQRLRDAGVDVTFHEYEDMVHDWHMLVPGDPPAREAVEEIGGFVSR